ncbi:MAG: HAD-IC family P-type ATPase [Verrucomicrobiaceae bacterium]|nr:HAD-IC family P-type ATPase [Verrucomicrobiaceae bacterium]
MAAIANFAKAGIAVKMITGDHLITARAIATQIGLKGDAALTGSELEKITDADLPEVAERTTVFARVAPEQKLRLVKALQARGHVVAMTGDGVNDAPALKQADIGVAMGISGTDVAKGAAAMILTDDNFASIEAAVEEGRGVYDNLTKFIVWIIPTNLGESLMLLSAILFGLPLPLVPLQLLWINLTDTVLGLSLAFEPKEADVMNRPPRPTQQPMLPKALVLRSMLVSFIMVAGGLGLFLWELRVANTGLASARTAVVNAIVLVQIFYLFNCRSLKHPAHSLGLFTNRWVIAGALTMIAAQVLFTHAPMLNHLFHSAPISAGAWLRVIAAASVVFIAVEFEKWLRFRRQR